MDELSINGKWPNLINKTIDEFIAQEYWYGDEQVDQANILYIKASGTWFQLYFDYSIIFWRQGKEGLPDNMADQEENRKFGFPLVDYGKNLDIIGSTICSCEGELIPEGVQVRFEFSCGKSFTVKSVNDETIIKIKNAADK